MIREWTLKRTCRSQVIPPIPSMLSRDGYTYRHCQRVDNNTPQASKYHNNNLYFPCSNIPL